MKSINILILLIIIYLQFSFIFRNSGLVNYIKVKNEINNIRKENNIIYKKNIKLIKDINSLINDYEIIEEYARNELNFIKNDELFYLVN
ncbi:cell division protein FtsB [endosymbiont of Sipalinus gigas]|uniref:FtsB family cell division protein n=1 Tax=endosymbiont of Sipalinus gigas TaxID=1972134 RepID=UPI000DC6DE19|nr:septum formation initiator family protein [endosymbiont of Sipalinus gigas]BBA85283.1 cell division protein FtsB [endosymbiont of Sipalinus gigas]